MGEEMRIGSIIGLIVVVWLVIGAIAAGQRGYFSAPPAQCSQFATIALNIVAGPLNYTGLDPQGGCEVPQPS
ncbi:hypothetical protein J2790_000176 [Paenarthrobacter nicotinovorans]|nr:hypothetical protein [Paenarthrobacter nicotinovorans]BCW60250.1 hypothetical protein StoSoilB20_35970 [Arthrobacter sp. StoSoilB20]SCZ58980.1 hypothetical protein SAMN02799638_02596 [Arthrobacter sp. UNCCL28]